MKKLEKSVDTIMNMPAFQQIAKDPDRCNRLIREGSYSKVPAGMSDPFASVPVDKQREVLEKPAEPQAGENVPAQQVLN